MENQVVEYLGILAAKNEAAAQDPTLTQSSRIFLADLADRYREAQYVELRKEVARHDRN